MVKKDSVCTSCNCKLMSSQGSVSFQCPECTKEEIVRCSDCRKNSIRYMCSACKFEGPN